MIDKQKTVANILNRIAERSIRYSRMKGAPSEEALKVAKEAFDDDSSLDVKMHGEYYYLYSPENCAKALKIVAGWLSYDGDVNEFLNELDKIFLEFYHDCVVYDE